jgi:sugar phosphate isomerase/epimerase
MSSMNRRELLTAAAGLAAAGRAARGHEGVHSVFGGVTVGAQSYSFRDRSLDDAIAGMREIGIGECEMWSGHIELKPDLSRRNREDLRKWRLTVELADLEKIAKRFQHAGVELYAFNYSVREDFTDAEIERGFEMCTALGAKVITASSNVTLGKRIDGFAKKHKIRVGMHNHSRIRENEFATPNDFERAMRGTEYIGINLDIGHFTAAGFDAVEYLDKHHDKIVTLHIKDRKKDQGDNVEFGDGDTPIVETLHLLRSKKFRIPANIEYEYKGADTIAEVRKCFEYCKAALLS